MFRRAFIAAGASALAAAPALAAARMPAARHRHRLTGSYVTSLRPEALAGLAPGARLELRRDPQRRFEPAQAVAVLAAGRPLGYLPGTSGKLVGALLDSEVASLEAEVTGIRPGARPAVDLEIYIG